MLYKMEWINNEHKKQIIETNDFNDVVNCVNKNDIGIMNANLVEIEEEEN